MIRVQIPDMPSAAELRPYLERIDSGKCYVNRGPLVLELEERLGKMCGVPVVTVSSGTAALELSLNHLGTYVSATLPALTFCATGQAARNSRLEVKLRDIGADLHMHDDSSVGRPGIVIPVATFGRPVNTLYWVTYRCPVVIDAAGAFPAQQCSKDPNITTCFSLHATKFIGAGEGGFVASANTGLLDTVRSMSTFGTGGTNAKMSEYHAAVAHASLDRMEEKSFSTQLTNHLYAAYGEGLEFYDNGFEYNTLKVVILPEGASATKIAERLLRDGIETRQWYRPWLDERPEFGSPYLPVTDSFRDRLLGVPFHTQLTRQDVAWVTNKLRAAIYED